MSRTRTEAEIHADIRRLRHLLDRHKLTSNIYFNKEMIPATAVTVEAGRIAFMGQIAAKEAFSRKNRDDAETHYSDLLGLGMLGNLQSVDRDSKTANEFWKQAVKDAFKDEPDWQELARRQQTR
jgi:hypothetical protein